MASLPSRDHVSQRVANLGVSPIRHFFERAAQLDDVIQLGIGDSSFETPEWIRTACKNALDQGLTRYTPFNGIRELRVAVAEKLRRENGLDHDPDREVVVTAGATAALYQAIHVCVNPGDEVLIPSPGWSMFAPMIQLAGGVPVYYRCRPDHGYDPDPDEVRSLISQQTKLIILNSPSNPTGGVISESRLVELCEVAKAADLVVVSDEVYERIMFDGERHVSPASLPGMKERTITVNSTSKTFCMTGWRLGYAAGPPSIIDGVSKLSLYTNVHPNTMAQHASVVALSGKHEDLLDDIVSAYKERRDYLVDHLNEIPGIRCTPSKGSIFLFPSIEGTGMSSFAFAEYLLERARISVVPGSGFGPYGEGFVRMCFAQSREDLAEAVSRLGRLVDEMQAKTP